MTTIPVVVKHQRKKYNVDLDPTSNGETFKFQLYPLTNVEPNRQKVLIRGGVLKDSTDLSTLNAEPGQIFIMMGTPSVDAVVITISKKVKFMEDMTNAEAAKMEGATPAELQNLGVNSEDEGDMRLHEASENGDEKTVHRLLKDGADVNAKDGYDETPLFCAASYGHKKVVELLLKNEADIEAGNVYGTALHAAAENGHAEVVRLLLEEGADINTEDKEGKIALDKAAGRRREVMAKLGQESPHIKGLEAVVRLLRKARGNVEERRG